MASHKNSLASVAKPLTARLYVPHGSGRDSYIFQDKQHELQKNSYDDSLFRGQLRDAKQGDPRYRPTLTRPRGPNLHALRRARGKRCDADPPQNEVARTLQRRRGGLASPRTRNAIDNPFPDRPVTAPVGNVHPERIRPWTPRQPLSTSQRYRDWTGAGSTASGQVGNGNSGVPDGSQDLRHMRTHCNDADSECSFRDCGYPHHQVREHAHMHGPNRRRGLTPREQRTSHPRTTSRLSVPLRRHPKDQQVTKDELYKTIW